MGTDVNASFSGSSSATSGIRDESSRRYGDIILGGGKPTPPYLWIALAALVLVGATVYIIRK